MSQKALAAEFIGTFTFVSAVCGAQLFAAPAGGGLIAVAFAAGLSVLAMAYALGHISGGHFNPAVTVGLIAAGRFSSQEAVGYIFAQVIGAVAAALLFSVILTGAPVGAVKWSSFPAISNSFGGPAQFAITSVVAVEILTTALFMVVFVGATSKRAASGFAPIAIGLAMTLCYLIAIPVSNASLNPARSTATALLAGGPAIANLWVFWVAPMIGAAIGGAVSKWLQNE